MDTLMNIERAILLFFQSIRNPVTDPIFGFFSIIGNAGFIWLITSVILIINKKTRRAGLEVLVCISLCWAVSDLILKPLIMRLRPFDVIDSLSVLYERFADAGSYSFPSGHSTSSFASAFALSVNFKKQSWIFYTVAALIAISRLYIGVHFPTDVICGALLGTLGAAGVMVLSRKLLRT